MIAGFHENIRAGVVFEGKGLRPVWFSMRGCKVVIKDVYYHWKEKHGGETVHKFTVTDGEHFYELKFSPRELKWSITAVD